MDDSRSRAGVALAAWTIALPLLWVVLWTIFDVLRGAFPLLATAGGGTLFWSLAKILFWAGPVWLWIVRVEQAPPLPWLGLRMPSLQGVLILLVLCVALGAMVVEGASPDLSRLAHITVLGSVLVAPLVEEIFFRGFYLNLLVRLGLPYLPANLLAAVAFAGMHLPGWFFQGTLFDGNNEPQALVVLGFIFGLGRRATGTLWGAIALHLVNNLLAIVSQ